MWQQDSYLYELDARQTAVKLEVAELRKLHARARQDHSAMAQELQSIQEQFDREAGRLTALSTELAVVERQLKDTRNEILLLRRDLSGTKSKVVALDEEFANREADLSQLRQTGNRLHGEAERLESQEREAIAAIAAIDQKRRRLLSAIEQDEARRSRLVKEIEERLVLTEAEREGILGDLQDASITFLSRIVERDSVKEILAREEASVAALSEGVSRLDNKRRSLQEAEMLHQKRSALGTEISNLENQVKSVDLGIQELQKALAAGQTELDMVSRENGERRSTMSELENRVGPYDELVSKVTDAESRLSALRGMNEKGVKALDHSLTNNANLECELQVAQEKFNVLVKLAGELFSAG
jgi:chromosome segregation ATPase